MSHAQKIKDVLANSYEISRAELVQRTGLTRAQVRKALPLLLKTKEVERWVDEQGVEYLSEGGNVETRPAGNEQCVEQSQGRGVEPQFDRDAALYKAGVEAGYQEAWIEIERAIGVALRKFLELGDIDE